MCFFLEIPQINGIYSCLLQLLMPPITWINISSGLTCTHLMAWTIHSYTHTDTMRQHTSTLVAACLLSVKSRSPSSSSWATTTTSFPLSPLTCHSAFLKRPPDSIFPSFFFLFSSCDICSIHNPPELTFWSRPVTFSTGISVPDLNFDIFWTETFEDFDLFSHYFFPPILSPFILAFS